MRRYFGRVKIKHYKSLNKHIAVNVSILSYVISTNVKCKDKSVNEAKLSIL